MNKPGINKIRSKKQLYKSHIAGELDFVSKYGCLKPKDYNKIQARGFKYDGSDDFISDKLTLSLIKNHGTSTYTVSVWLNLDGQLHFHAVKAKIQHILAIAKIMSRFKPRNELLQDNIDNFSSKKIEVSARDNSWNIYHPVTVSYINLPVCYGTKPLYLLQHIMQRF